MDYGEGLSATAREAGMKLLEWECSFSVVGGAREEERRLVLKTRMREQQACQLPASVAPDSGYCDFEGALRQCSLRSGCAA